MDVYTAGIAFAITKNLNLCPPVNAEAATSGLGFKGSTASASYSAVTKLKPFVAMTILDIYVTSLARGLRRRQQLLLIWYQNLPLLAARMRMNEVLFHL
ncbi:hypothetical protein RRG08_056853 [Elysia crispata]|uniref:Uncharacterized protein n=1 Tax=Elysia crispata TaxID=231223 RepID=A0AAE1ABK7_9GAST|nr:hypothetical protein RRG08_056853 [Elysia crispata]